MSLPQLSYDISYEYVKRKQSRGLNVHRSRPKCPYPLHLAAKKSTDSSWWSSEAGGKDAGHMSLGSPWWPRLSPQPSKQSNSATVRSPAAHGYQTQKCRKQEESSGLQHASAFYPRPKCPTWIHCDRFTSCRSRFNLGSAKTHFLVRSAVPICSSQKSGWSYRYHPKQLQHMAHAVLDRRQSFLLVFQSHVQDVAREQPQFCKNWLQQMSLRWPTIWSNDIPWYQMTLHVLHQKSTTYEVSATSFHIYVHDLPAEKKTT